jgi:2-iminobutanoate/2-iminopropanoate deaminase
MCFARSRSRSRAAAPNAASNCAPSGGWCSASATKAARWLYVSGQVGALPDGRMAEGFEAQAEQTWHNLLAVLGDAGMGVADLVKVNAFLLRNEDYPVYNRIRTRFLGDARPASTALVVPVLANPEWLFELDAVAARA